MADKLSEDFLWNAFENVAQEKSFMGDWDRKVVSEELLSLLSSGIDLSTGILAESVVSGFPELYELMNRMKIRGMEEDITVLPGVSGPELYNSDDEKTMTELNYSALEMISGILVHEKIISEMKLKNLFFAGEYV